MRAGILILSILLICSSNSFAKEKTQVIIIEPGVGSTDSGGSVGSTRKEDYEELLHRVHRLEQAVRQLQDRIYDNAQNSDSKSGWSTCYIESSFKGTFMETSPTETAARAGALKKCHDGDGGLSCSEHNIKCGK